ncbi:MAG TPA: phosphotransferase, partial [Planctomycetota bacterium]|nr:phosphotransferase [Planctomycetota bacterium]
MPDVVLEPSGWRDAILRHVAESLQEIEAKRWYRDKGKRIDSFALVDFLVLEDDERSPPVLALVEMCYGDGTRGTYFLFLAQREEERGGVTGRLVEALPTDTAWARLGRSMLARRTFETPKGRFLFRPGYGERVSQVRQLLEGGRGGPPKVRALGAEQTNTSFVIDEAILLKAYRRADPGPHPELEVLTHLDEHGMRDGVPALLGSIEYEAHGESAPRGLVLLQELISGSRDAWTVALEDLRGVIAGRPSTFLETTVASLGALTARLHEGLATLRTIAVERPTGLRAALLARIDSLISEIDEAAGVCPPDLERRVRALLGTVRQRVLSLPRDEEWGRCARVHGDFHLGQILVRDGHLWIVDFEGEPTSAPEIRRAGFSPAKDVAGMLRSFDYAVAIALEKAGKTHESAGSERRAPDGSSRESDGSARSSSPAEAWRKTACARFQDAWEKGMERSEVARALLPAKSARGRVIAAYET